jgi:hypothetical protein
VETLLVRAGDGPVLQVPLTYRAAPLEGAEAWLIGTMEHGVLGTRWTYDALGDPVYLETLATAVLTGGRDADAYYEVDGKRVARVSTAPVIGSGTAGAAVPELTGPIVTRDEGWASTAETATLSFTVARAPVAHPLAGTDSERLDGTWTDQATSTALATVSLRT